MHRKILITITDDISHLHGVRFVGSFFKNKSAVSATLYYVAPHTNISGKGSNGEQAFDISPKRIDVL